MRTLYHTPLSPFCRKIRVALAEKRLEFELETENVWERREDFIAINPACEVPVLVDADGLIVCGAYPIAEYLEELYPEITLLGGSPEEKVEVRRVMAWFDEKFNHEVTRNLLYEKIFKRLMGYGEPRSDIIRTGHANLPDHLDYIAYLLEGRTWLAGEAVTMADITAAAHISSIDYLGDVPWDRHEGIREWYALMKSRPSFRPLLQDRIAGVKPPAHYENPDF